MELPPLPTWSGDSSGRVESYQPRAVRAASSKCSWKKTVRLPSGARGIVREGAAAAKTAIVAAAAVNDRRSAATRALSHDDCDLVRRRADAARVPRAHAHEIGP